MWKFDPKKQENQGTLGISGVHSLLLGFPIEDDVLTVLDFCLLPDQSIIKFLSSLI